MKIKSLLPVLVIIFACLMLNNSCRKNDVTFPDPSTLREGLPGTWVEINTLEDTITFDSNKDTGFFYLSRGFGWVNGYWLPRIGSAPYRYIISGESINVMDGLSSSLEGGDYYFSFNKPELIIRIGKFSKYIDTKNTILTFRKIK